MKTSDITGLYEDLLKKYNDDKIIYKYWLNSSCMNSCFKINYTEDTDSPIPFLIEEYIKKPPSEAVNSPKIRTAEENENSYSEEKAVRDLDVLLGA